MAEVYTRLEYDDMGTGAYHGVALYDFETDGGAVGNIGMGLKVPADVVILYATINVRTAPTSGGAATVALTLQTTADVLVATAIASVTGLINGRPDWAVANAIKTTAERELSLTVAVAALTAGKIEVHLHGYKQLTLA